jgi:hypothetical protein
MSMKVSVSGLMVRVWCAVAQSVNVFDAAPPHRRPAVKSGLANSEWEHIITAAKLPLDNSFASLPPAFYTRLMPTPLPAPYLVASAPGGGADRPDAGASADGLDILIGNAVPERAQPLAAVYSGHQFGVWAGQLGDGRAILLGEVATRKARWSCNGKAPA